MNELPDVGPQRDRFSFGRKGATVIAPRPRKPLNAIAAGWFLDGEASLALNLFPWRNPAAPSALPDLGAGEFPDVSGGVRAVDSMIDRKQQPRSGKPRPAASGQGEAPAEEARLRQQAIGVGLRQMFDQVVNEPVPDEFLDILRSADQRRKEAGE
jgi:hypothetical protein